jgi:hypothetical protein
MNIIEYCTHINNHNIEFGSFHISNPILEYLIKWNIEPDQEKLDNEIGYEDDILMMSIVEFDHEIISLDLLDLLDPDNMSCRHMFDDQDKLREYLFSKGIINDINCDLCEISMKYSFEEWENFCHYTNNSLLMFCIKKKWNKFCMRLLDFDVLYDINHQNITNAYEMALKYNLVDVAKKIKNDKRFCLNSIKKIKCD